ncbi:hypothetical protein [Roseovarius sp. THAF27]|uniref:hypothetical protein n=1 Tax=Roseovarius sp. THAF27 TaxID=2587850 RepID=UPI0012684B10|nr:hypothetical protein [Roseovarius sp. THAF27]
MIFSFTKNYIESVTFLRDLKVAALKKAPPNIRHSVFIDLSEVKDVSPAAALVLAAEVDRWRQVKRTRLAPRNVSDWDPFVLQTLHSMGFFRLLGVESGVAKSNTPQAVEVTMLPIVSSTRLEGGLLQPMMDLLARAANILGQDPLIYPALTEAAYNATLHAYPDDQPTEFPIPAKCWWATACWNIEGGVVKFIVYDQGVGIPATLPRSKHWEQVRALFPQGLRVATADASRLIAAAIQFDRTSLEGGHGKGLQDVVTPVDKTVGAKVRLLSGTGKVTYHNGGGVKLEDETLHIGGTLVEWTIPVDSYLPE